MSDAQPRVILIELPTFPKGIVALSIYAVAAAFDPKVLIEVIDLNIQTLDAALPDLGGKQPLLCGLKVSAQNYKLAIDATAALKQKFPATPVLWGGELPTLLPDECLAHCDSVVRGAFEPVASRLCADLLQGKLEVIYEGGSAPEIQQLRTPRLDLLPHPERYPRFMGLPMESSRGCTYKCTFCMVHTMQPGYATKTEAQLQEELKSYDGHFLNLVDYNFGVDEAHVIRVAAAIAQSGVLGWMGEMCLESLDNDRILQALTASRCRMIYCGLEAVDELGLKSINKSKTNQIANYERIIRKVQAHGIQIAAGMIIGLDGASLEGFEQMRMFFQRMGILYIKLTFITYNPGTKVKESMLRKGNYVTESIEHFDGNHLTFLANGLQPELLHECSRRFIRRFYSRRDILIRSFQSKMSFASRLEFLYFNFCYREFYLQWLEHDIFRDEAGYQRLLAATFQPSSRLSRADRWLTRIRKWRFHRS